MTPLSDILWLEDAQQRLGLVPALGGGLAAWQWTRRAASGKGAPVDLFRPWPGATDDRYSLASFAMLPWSNRISGGGFDHGGRFYAVAPNRPGEPYPIHGDGWLQPWEIERAGAGAASLRLQSRGFGGDPYRYDAQQSFVLEPGVMHQSVRVTHVGSDPLPYGLGLHPWFPRTATTRLQARVQGVWLCGADPIPTRHTRRLPDTWDPCDGLDVNGSLIDNCYTGWSGEARIAWPEAGLSVHLADVDIRGPAGRIGPEFCLLYRPPHGTSFCFEPVTQPIDPFHLAGRPGLQVLRKGESLQMSVAWRILVE